VSNKVNITQQIIDEIEKLSPWYYQLKKLQN
jgi:hypothetical protein